jgi:hypothetical protein
MADRPSGPFSLSAASEQARGLLLWVPLTHWSGPRVWCTPGMPTQNGQQVFTGAPGLQGFVNNASSSRYLQLPNGSNFDLPGDFTISLWVRLANSASTHGVFDKVRGDQTSPAWSVHVASTSAMRFQPNIAGVNQVIDSAGTVALRTPTNAVIRRSGTSYTWLLNGVVSGTQTKVGAIATNSTGPYIGRLSDGVFSLDGVVSDIRIYNRALSDVEAWSLYAPASRWDLYWTPTRRAYAFLGHH